MDEDIVKGRFEDRRSKLCECSVCGIVERCTPNNDFYDNTKRWGDKLACSSCLWKNVRNFGDIDEILDSK